jgi:hypothetical protein
VDQADKPVYVGRTVRSLSARLSSHRRARNAEWLRACNQELAAWLEENSPAAIVLDEVTQPGAEWAAERAWIEKFADLGLLNITGNPLRSPKRRGGDRSPAAA